MGPYNLYHPDLNISVSLAWVTTTKNGTAANGTDNFLSEAAVGSLGNHKYKIQMKSGLDVVRELVRKIEGLIQ